MPQETVVHWGNNQTPFEQPTQTLFGGLKKESDQMFGPGRSPGGAVLGSKKKETEAAGQEKPRGKKFVIINKCSPGGKTRRNIFPTSEILGTTGTHRRENGI